MMDGGYVDDTHRRGFGQPEADTTRLKEEELEEKPNCYNCGYRGKIPGDAHSRCRFDWAKSELKAPAGHEHGVRNGWWMFPFNFDPTWMLGECSAHAAQADPSRIADTKPMLDLFMFLGAR